MHPYRKLASILVAIAIPVGTMASLASGSPAWAKSGGATGTVNCSGASGSVSFNPALVPGGTKKEKKVTVAATLGTCTGGSPRLRSAR